MILPDKKILFVHIPKCGGSSMAAGLFQSVGIEYSTYIKLNKKEKNTYLCSNELKHAPAIIMQNHIKNYDDYYKFAIVRNPWDRLISSYNWVNGAGDAKFDHKSIQKQFNKAQRKIDEKNELKNYQYLPQKKFIVDKNENIIVDDIFCMSQIEKIFEKFDLKYFHKKKRNSKSKLPSDMENMFDDATRKIYRDDINFFGYEKGGSATRNVTIL